MQRFALYSTLVALSTTLLETADAQVNAAALEQVGLLVAAEHQAPGAKVRITFLDGPDSLRGAVRDVALPFGLRVPGRSLKVRIEPLALSGVTKVQVKVWRGGELSGQGTVTGAGAFVDVNDGSISLRTSPPTWRVWPLRPRL